jgi:hypothetical protein
MGPDQRQRAAGTDPVPHASDVQETDAYIDHITVSA